MNPTIWSTWTESHSSIPSDSTTSDRDYEDDEDSASNVALHPDTLAYNIPRIARRPFFEMTAGVRASYEMDARAIHYWWPYEGLPDQEVVFPVNHLLRSMWKQVEVFIGGKLISSGSTNYHYKSMIKTLLNNCENEGMKQKLCTELFRWFKFTLKPPYSIACGKLQLAIWDTSFWTFWLKFGHNGP